ncbi:MAG: hypothetical protein WAP52_03385 [Candidatus Sungiibacteriota bacterium]
MSKLDELEEDLYGNDPTAAARRRKPGAPLAPSRTQIRSGWEGGGQAPALLLSASRRPMKKIIMIGAAGVLLFAAGGIALIYFYLGVDRREAEVIIGGPDSIEAGQAVTIPITVRNISATALEDANLALTIPAGAIIKDASGLERAAESRTITHIGTLAPGDTQTQEITLRLFGHEREEQEVTAVLLYRPANLSAQFSSQGSRRIVIDRVPLELFWDVPEKVSARQQVSIVLRLSSQARMPFGGLWLRADYPPGFTLASADPKPAVGDALWKIDTLDTGKEETITITGAFDGTSGEIKAFRAGLGSFNELTKEWKPWRESAKEIMLSSSPLLLAVTIQGKREGVIRPGERIDIAIHYENRSTVPIKNISLHAAIEGAIADVPSMMIANGGVFNAAIGAVVWGPGGTPQLREVAPGAGGDLSVSISTKPRPVMRSADDKNLLLRVVASITSADAPEELRGVLLSADDVVAVKVATIALVSGRAAFRSSPIFNTGSLPPKVGQKTSYTIIWEARNFTNDIENAELRASLPPNIQWAGATFPASAQISFDSAASEVRWRIGKLPAGTGVITPSLTAAFQVSITPSSVDIGKYLTIASDAQFTGRDTFTGEDITGRIDAFTTELHDDQATAPDDWRVIK